MSALFLLSEKTRFRLPLFIKIPKNKIQAPLIGVPQKTKFRLPCVRGAGSYAA